MSQCTSELMSEFCMYAQLSLKIRFNVVFSAPQTQIGFLQGTVKLINQISENMFYSTSFSTLLLMEDSTSAAFM